MMKVGSMKDRGRRDTDESTSRSVVHWIQGGKESGYGGRLLWLLNNILFNTIAVNQMIFY